jgi:DNA/RNA-binding domain of Phe-tRNA-synthetase-like protein
MQEKLARDAATGDALDQQSVANYSQLLNTIAADEVQLKSVQEDLRRIFQAFIKAELLV